MHSPQQGSRLCRESLQSENNIIMKMVVTVMVMLENDDDGSDDGKIIR